MSSATEDRRKIFGWISIELIVQFLFVVVAIATAYSYLSSQVAVQARDNMTVQAKLEVISESLSRDALDIRANTTINAQQDGQIKALEHSRDADRKLLMDIKADVAVLLDRTDPRKVQP